jgi:hypothetical protein
MIRQTWPRCALYVLCPPFALNVLHLIYPTSNVGLQLALTVLLVLVSLLAKGAIAAFYLRERGSYSDDGAAYITAAAEPPGSVPLTTPIEVDTRPGDVVEVTMQGNAANVMLMDSSNFQNYQSGRQFTYHGGPFAKSPAILHPPSPGHWYVVVDLADGAGRVGASVRVIRGG